MLDYLNWYLVELETRIRNRMTAAACADYLSEVRNHLDEKVEELTGKGLDPRSAAKAAIAEFGDPDLLVHKKTHSISDRFMTWIAYLSAVGASIGLIGLMFETIKRNDVAMAWLWIALIPLSLSILLIAWRSRVWIALPVCLLGLFFTGIGATLIAALTSKIEITGRSFTAQSSEYILDYLRDSYIATNTQWLNEYDRDYALLSAYRSSDRQSPRSLAILKNLTFSNAVGPQKHVGHAYAITLPSQYAKGIRPSERHFNSVNPYTFDLQLLSTWQEAANLWRTNADEYADFLKSERRRIESQTLSLQNPIQTTLLERTLYWSYLLLPLAGIVSVILLLLNGIVIGVSDIYRPRVKRRWRTRLG